MADAPKAEDAPEGFWDEFGKWLSSDPEIRTKALKLFAERNDAPAPTPNDGTPPKEEPKKSKGWFGNAAS